MTVDGQVCLLFWQRLAASNTQLPLDQVSTGNRFGDRVFYLQARVHFHKVEIHAAKFIFG